MARPIVLQDDWSIAQKSDVPREKLPKNASYKLTDVFVNLGAPLRKRGGWNRYWASFGSGYMQAVGVAPFTAGYRIVGVDSSGTCHHMTYSATTTTAASATVNNLAHSPIFYRQVLYFPDVNGTAALRQMTSAGTVTSTAGSPPAGSVGCTWNDHLVLARSSTNKERVWFSTGGSATVWDTAAEGQWVDMDAPVQGMATIKGMIMVFEEGQTERLRGTIIPGVVGSDMVREKAFSVGCSDPASIASTDDYIVFANSDGVYITDGSGVVSLTEQGGINNEWRDTLASYSTSWTIAGTVYRGYYIVSVMDSTTFKCAYWCDVRRRTWGNLTNVKASMLASSPIGSVDMPPKIVMAERGATRVADLTTMWTPSSSYKNDGDGTAVTFSVESPFFQARPGLKRWKKLWLTYHMTDAASDNPTISVGYQKDVASSSYTTLSETLPETSRYLSAPVALGLRSEGLGFKFSQTNASADTRIYVVESELQPMEPSRRYRA